MSKNIYLQAAELLDKKNDYKLTEEERLLINMAIIPLIVMDVRFPEDITLREGLKELAKIMDGVAAPRRRAVVARVVHNHQVVGSNPTAATNYPPGGIKVNETRILMCLPVEGDPNRYIVPSSVVAKCADCGAPVYVAPSAHKLQETATVTVVCINCALARLEKEKEPKFELVPGQGWEIEAWRRRH